MTVSPADLQKTLMERLEAIKHFGRVEGVGLWRRPFTPEEAACLDLVGGWMRAAGLSVRRDAAGNLIGRVEGHEPDSKVVACGSHLDSVKNGGDYDGPLGTLAALTAVEHLLRTAGPPRCPVEVVAFTGEEGSRFPGGFIGSRAVAGVLDERELAKVDEQGVSMAQAIREAGFDTADLPSCRRTDWGAFLELHVEQGRVLESMGLDIGLVYAIVGMLQVRVTVGGRADHAGTTPMDLRHDAMRAAAQMIVSCSQLIDEAGPPTVLTCGRLELSPGATNIVAERVQFTFDYRDADPERRRRLGAELRRRCEAIAAERHVEVAWEVFHDVEPVPSDGRLITTLEAAAMELKLPSLLMVSGAGHDAMVVARTCPMAMLFVPSKNGRSHTPEEYTSPEHCARGAAVILETLRRLAW